MKIVQINSVCNLGSTGRIAEGIGEQVVKFGGESYIAYGRNSNHSKFSKELKIGNSIDIYTHVLLSRITDRIGFFSKKATKNIINQLKTIKPDIIHIHNLHGYYINIEILFEYIKEAKIPIIWTLHDCWAFTGHCAYYEYVNCEKWKKQCYDCPQINQYPKSFYDNSTKNFLDKKKIFTSVNDINFVPVSNWIERELSKSFFSGYPKKVIHNGIDLDIFKPLNSTEKIKKIYNIKDEKIILGVANVWDERKGLKYFLELSELLSENYKLILVGLNESQLKSLPNNIIGIKKTENINQLVELYSVASVYVNPTLEDNFPTTNIESLACGTPVITFPSGGSPEIIDSGTGIVTKNKTAKDLSRCINEILLNSKESYTQKCRSRAEKLYNKNDNFLKYIKIYKEIIDTRI